MTRYTPLEEYLKERSEARIPLCFNDIEKIIGRPLPASAREYRAWWSNDFTSTHVQARAWGNAGYHTEDVDMESEKLTFVRVR